MLFCLGLPASSSGWLRRPSSSSHRTAAGVLRRVWKQTDWRPASSWAGRECSSPTVGVPPSRPRTWQPTARGRGDGWSRPAKRKPSSSRPATWRRVDGLPAPSDAVRGRWTTATNWWRPRGVSTRWNWRRPVSPDAATSLAGSETRPGQTVRSQQIVEHANPAI